MRELVMFGTLEYDDLARTRSITPKTNDDDGWRREEVSHWWIDTLAQVRLSRDFIISGTVPRS